MGWNDCHLADRHICRQPSHMVGQLSLYQKEDLKKRVGVWLVGSLRIFHELNINIIRNVVQRRKNVLVGHIIASDVLIADLPPFYHKF
jgi:hypothetical protein